MKGHAASRATLPPSRLGSSPESSLLLRLKREPLLLSAFLAVGLMAGFQLTIHLLQPPWIGTVNDWLLTVLAWLELLVLVGISRWFTRIRRPGALAWWLVSAALLCSALRRTLLLAGNPALTLPLVSVSRWEHLFILPQSLFLVLAFLLLPATAPPGQHWLIRLRVFLDSILLMSAVTLLSWYFLLLPLSLQHGLPQAERITNLALVLSGLGLLFILILLLIREHRLALDRLVLGLLILAVLLVLIGNFWLAVLDLETRHASSDPPDAFWILGYMLFPLAGLVQVRLAQGEPGGAQGAQETTGIHWQDLLDYLRLMLPFVVTLLASLITILGAILAPTVESSLIPALVLSMGLLALMMVRQGLLFLEQGQLRREQAAARVRELALVEVNRQMETFILMASHELKTPLTVLLLHQQRAMRRLQHLEPEMTRCPPEVVQSLERCKQDWVGTETQLKRQSRLINELLDLSRIQVGQLALHLERGDLQAIVQAIVEEQREAWPERSIQLWQPSERAVPIEADLERLGQVVTNYLTNALRYSAEQCPVEVGVRVEEQQGVVWVRDQGPGLPPEECEHIWERFYRAPGSAIQSGSGVGLGIGLYLCKKIVGQHHGQVGVESAPGAGSTFWFRLPLQQPAEG